MPKSDLTIEQLEAQAMLLGDGWHYDARDHTFFRPNLLPVMMLDADTLEPLTYIGTVDKVRRNLVGAGKLGAADGEV